MYQRPGVYKLSYDAPMVFIGKCLVRHCALHKPERTAVTCVLLDEDKPSQSLLHMGWYRNDRDGETLCLPFLTNIMKTVLLQSAKLSKVIEGRESGKMSQKAIDCRQVPQSGQTSKSGSTIRPSKKFDRRGST